MGFSGYCRDIDKLKRTDKLTIERSTHQIKMKVIVLKDNDSGKLLPLAGIWKDDEKLKYFVPDILKIMKRDKHNTLSLARATLDETGEISLSELPK